MTHAQFNPNADDYTLDALFCDWNTDRQSSEPKPLSDWIARYPRYEAQFRRWAGSAPVAEWFAYQPLSEEEEQRAATVTQGAIRELRARYNVAAPTPLQSLLEQARRKGVNLDALCRNLGVGETIVFKLERRLLRFTSIPRVLIESLADTLQTSAAQVRDYLQQPAALAMGASYKSSGVPKVAEPEDFLHALADCDDMDTEQKAFWTR